MQTDRPSILQRPPYQNLTARESVEREGLAGRVVIGRGYQRIDEAFKAWTCLVPENEGWEITDSPLPATNIYSPYIFFIHNSFWLVEAYNTECQREVNNFSSLYFFKSSEECLWGAILNRSLSLSPLYLILCCNSGIWVGGEQSVSRVFGNKVLHVAPRHVLLVKQLILCNPHHAFGRKKRWRDTIFRTVLK